MRELDIPISDWSDADGIATRVEQVLGRCDLLLTMRGTLKSHPGCVHWHYKKGIEPGTLELTLWPAKRRLWIKVQDGRAAPWIDQMIPQIARELGSV